MGGGGSRADAAKVNRNKKATFFPEAELADRPSLQQTAEDYRLSYTLTIHTKAPVEERKQLFIDAYTGELLLKLNSYSTPPTPVQPETKYSGAGRS